MTRYEGKFKENCPDIMADKYKKYSKLVDATFALVLIGVVLLMLCFIALVYLTATCKCL